MNHHQIKNRIKHQPVEKTNHMEHSQEEDNLLRHDHTRTTLRRRAPDQTLTLRQQLCKERSTHFVAQNETGPIQVAVFLLQSQQEEAKGWKKGEEGELW